MATNYKQFNLLEVVDISGARVHKFEGTKKYIATADLGHNKIISDELVTYDYRPSRADLVMKEDEVLFAKMKATKKVLAGFTGVDDLIFSTGFYILKPKENISKQYLYFYLLSDDFNNQKDMYCSGATMAAIGNQGLKKIHISVPVDSKGNPDLKEQERIASLLEEAEILQEKRTEADQKMEEVIPALFNEMFGNTKFESRKLGDSISYLTSGARGWAKYYSNESGYKYIRIQNVKNAQLHFDDVQFVNPPDSAEAKRIKVQENDLLISITADLGRTAVVDSVTAFDGAYINQHLALVRLNEDFNAVFVAHYLENNGKSQFAKYGQAAAKKGLNFDSIKSLMIPCPPIKIQNEFVDKVQKILSLKQKQKESAVKIDNLFTSLLAEHTNNQKP